MLVGITGTPGTGKTSVAGQLKKRSGYQVVHLNELIKEEKLYSEVDTERDCVVADMDIVEQRVMEKIDVVLQTDKHSLSITMPEAQAQSNSVQRGINHKNHKKEECWNNHQITKNMLTLF